MLAELTKLKRTYNEKYKWNEKIAFYILILSNVREIILM